jgi:hypothetical protein
METQTISTPPRRPRGRIRKIVGALALSVVVLIVVLVIIGLATAGKSGAPGNPTAKPAAQAATSAPASTPASSAPATLGFGATQDFVYSDGTKVSVTSATPATLSQEAAGGNAGDPAVNVIVKITAGKASIDASEIQASANGGPDGTQLSQAFDTDTNTPTGTLEPGQSGSYTFEFDLQQVANGKQLSISVTPGFDYQNAVFTGAVVS